MEHWVDHTLVGSGLAATKLSHMRLEGASGGAMVNLIQLFPEKPSFVYTRRASGKAHFHKNTAGKQEVLTRG